MTGTVYTADHHVYELPALLRWNVVRLLPVSKNTLPAHSSDTHQTLAPQGFRLSSLPG